MESHFLRVTFPGSLPQDTSSQHPHSPDPNPAQQQFRVFWALCVNSRKQGPHPAWSPWLGLSKHLLSEWRRFSCKNEVQWFTEAGRGEGSRAQKETELNLPVPLTSSRVWLETAVSWACKTPRPASNTLNGGVQHGYKSSDISSKSEVFSWMCWACEEESSRWFWRSSVIWVFQVRPHLECMGSISGPSQVLGMEMWQGARFSGSLRDGPGSSALCWQEWQQMCPAHSGGETEAGIVHEHLQGCWPADTYFAGLFPPWLPCSFFWHFPGLLPPTAALRPLTESDWGGASPSGPPSLHWNEGQLSMVMDDGISVGQSEGHGLPQPHSQEISHSSPATTI